MIKIMTLLLAFILVLPSGSAVAASYTRSDILKLANDKEVEITAFSAREKEKVLKKARSGMGIPSLLTDTFYNVFLDFLNEEDNACELNFIARFHNKLEERRVAHNKEDMEFYFKILRINNSIDDLLYDILVSVNADYLGMQKLNLTRSAASAPRNSKIYQFNKLEDLFMNFDVWPDEKENCSYQEFVFIKNNIKNGPGDKDISTKDDDLKTLIRKAHEDRLISLESYNKMEYLRTESNLNERNLWLADYLRTTFSVKNKLKTVKKTYVVKDLNKENPLASERVKRFSRLTNRKVLYQKYDENQIMMLAQVLQKASRRMGVDPDTKSGAAVIVQEFSVLQANGTRTNYVERTELDPQSQYNLARRLLRKDILDLQMMDTFAKVKITHIDVVMAAYETGYITTEDLDYVVKYDDLWNPEKTQWEKISSFVFKVAGYSSFFLPPPWNIVTSIAMGVAEGVVENKYFRNGVDNDNPATFIE